MSNTDNKHPLDRDLSPQELGKLVKRQRIHTEQILREQEAVGEYPDPEQVEEFDPADVTEIRFPGKLGIFGNIEPDQWRGKRGRKPQQGGRGGKGKGKGKGGNAQGGGNGRPLPNPQLVHTEVQKMLAHIPFAGNSGNLQIGELNAEFMDRSKARYFQDSYVEVVTRFHVLFLAEVEAGGVSHLASVTGYSGYTSTANTRNQAVGFLVHPRLKVLKVTEYPSIANVQGIPDLRPAYRLDLEDTVSGEKFSVVVLHLKSMRGGPQVTAVVRYKQFQLLVQDLGKSFKGLVGGDLNYKINDPTCKDADPMIADGYTLVGANDNSATQIMGSRIDGWFHKGLTVKLDFYKVVAYFTNPQLRRSFTDHATLYVEMLTSSEKSNADTTSKTSTSSDGDSDDDAGATQKLVGGAGLPKIVIRPVVPGASRKGRRRPTGR